GVTRMQRGPLAKDAGGRRDRCRRGMTMRTTTTTTPSCRTSVLFAAKTSSEAAMHNLATGALTILLLGQAEPSITVSGDVRQPRVSAHLPADVAAKLPAGKLTQEQGEAWLRFHRVANGKDGPAMLGDYARAKETLTFLPRFPLQPEKTYRARLLLPGGNTLAKDYTVPPRPPAPLTHVVKIYPSG